MLSFVWLLHIEKIYNVYVKQRERFNQNETFFFFFVFTLVMEHLLLWHFLPFTAELPSYVKFYIKTPFR